MKVIFAKTTEKFILNAKLSEDKLKLFIDVEPIPKSVIIKDELLRVVREGFPTIEVNEGVIEDIIKHLNQGQKVEERRIAKGVAPEDGADGKILLLVKKLSANVEVKIDSKGYADYGSLHLFDNIAKGQVIGRVYPPKNGTDGKDALGNPLPSKPGKPFKTSLDKNISLRAVNSKEMQFEEMVAEEDGYLAEEAGKFAIKPELFVKDNLDYRYGSLDFIGKVKVSGDVMPGFNITARKGIEVLGSIRGGSLVCMEGDIIVKGFVFGGKDSRVICGKSFTANVVQEINAEIAGPIIILKEAIDSNLRTESTLQVAGGQIVGGQAFAVCGVEAKYIGNEAGKETGINLCSDVETHTEYAKILANIDSHERAKKLMEVHLGPLAQNAARIQLLKSPHREHMSKFYQKLQEIEASRVKLLAKKKEMLEKARVNLTLRINYLSKYYQGAIIKAGDCEFSVKDNLKGPGTVEFHLQDKKFEVGPLKPLECTYQNADQSNVNGEKNE